jgi:DNA-binding SARP family transcriptional activator/Tfp pilus assembly protein PilF
VAKVGDREVPLGGSRARAVLACLLLEPNRVVSIDAIVAGAWGTEAPGGARFQAQNRMSALRRALREAGGGDAIDTAGAGYVIRVDPERLDARLFEDQVQAARRLMDAGDLAAATDSLTRALGLWRGPALHGLDTPRLLAAAQRLDEVRLSTRELVLDINLRRGQHQEIIGELLDLVAEHPWRERLAGQLMVALYRAGRRRDALGAFQRTRRLLATELGIDPCQDLVRLRDQIMRDDPALARVEPEPGPPPVPVTRPATPRMLPRAAPHFVGRERDLAVLDAASQGATSFAISTIVGPPGVGKTALAVHWAHRVRDRFGDGQLYLNLLGFDPGGATLPPTRALRTLLDALGIPPDRIPAEVEAQAGLYRSLLAGRRMLVVLDNALDAEQVRPLLPGTADCPVVVTSRNLLSGLVATEGALSLTVDLLAPDEARELLVRRLGAARVVAEPNAVDAIVAWCAGLPLALVIVAARAATRPSLSLAALVDGIGSAGRQDATSGSGATGADVTGRLDALRAGDPHSDVRAVFSWSYEALSDAARRLFRLLGLHPGADITAPAAASLTGVTLPRTRGLLTELAGAHLVAEHTGDRYALHDLLRAYATELTHDRDTDPDRREALHRLFDHYLHTAYAAMITITKQRDPVTVAPPLPGVTITTPTDVATALDGLAAEQANLLAVVTAAGELGFDRHTWQLAWTLEPFFTRRGQFLDWISTQTAALHAAERLGDRHTRARAHRNLGSAYAQLDRHEESESHLGHGLELCRQLGDHAGQAHTHHNLARIRERQGRHRDGLGHLEQALELYRMTGHTVGQARALNGIGWFHILLGEYERAVTYCEQAIDLQRANGGRTDLGDTWDSLGYAHDHLGHHAEAVACFQAALGLFREFGDRYNEAVTLSRLGDAHEHAGDHDSARAVWRQALDIFEALERSEAAAIRVKLANSSGL